MWQEVISGFHNAVFRSERTPNPSPEGKVARVSGSEEECGRKTESLYNITDLLLGQLSCPGAGLQFSGHPTLPPAFLFSQKNGPLGPLF